MVGIVIGHSLRKPEHGARSTRAVDWIIEIVPEERRAFAIAHFAEARDRIEAGDKQPAREIKAVLAAIRAEPQDAGAATEDASPDKGAPAGDTVADAAEPKERKVRAGTKQAMLIEMLRAPTGATIDEIVAATGWQPHTVRGAIAGALKKKLGLEVTSEKVEGRGRVFRVGD